MMDPFVYTGLPSRVVFGAGTLSRVSEELEALGISRALVLSTPHQVDQAEALRLSLGDRGAALFSNATMHTPVTVTEEALDIVASQNIDGTVALGGGSTIGLGKAIALRTDLPQLVIPTTYAGSEMTPILGQTDAGQKSTLRDLKVLPETVVYDVDLTLTLPANLSATSGMNAIAHAVEALYAKDRNPIVSLMARDAIRALTSALPRIAVDPGDRDARSDALYGAWLCGAALGSVGMALHHKLCHTLGGSFDLPHAETHTIVLPHVTAFNSVAADGRLDFIAGQLGSESPGAALFDLATRIGAPTALKDLGMPEEGIARAAEIAVSNPYWNPRPFERADIETLIRNAWDGQRPNS